MALAKRLRDYIESWTSAQRKRSRLLQATKEGRLTPWALASYLASLRYVFAQSPRNLSEAGRRSQVMGRFELGDYLFRKAAEEVGHDRWAESDLACLESSEISGVEPLPGAVALVELQYRLIDRDPLAYLCYTLWAEYFSVLIFDDWIDALGRSGYAPAQLTAFTKHAEADREHAADALREIDRFVEADTDIDEMLVAVEEACRLFERFCEEVHAIAVRGAA